MIVPNLQGKLAVVTGASDGIGLGLGLAGRLARAGAEVIIPVRNAAKGRAAVERIGGRVSTRTLDLASLESAAARLWDVSTRLAHVEFAVKGH